MRAQQADTKIAQHQNRIGRLALQGVPFAFTEGLIFYGIDRRKGPEISKCST